MSKTLAGAVAAFALAATGAVAQKAPAQKATAPAPIGIVEGPSPAKHRLTIVSAFSCPYCRVLDNQAMNELRTTWLRRGLQIESIPVSISPTDLPVAIAATCGDPRGYARRSTILFRAQPDILGNWNGADETAKKRALARPKGVSAADIGTLAGLVDLAPSLGLTKPQLQQCLADPVRQQRQVKREQLADARWNVEGTPTVFLDGKKVGNSWTTVRPAVVAAMR